MPAKSEEEEILEEAKKHIVEAKEEIKSIREELHDKPEWPLPEV